MSPWAFATPFGRLLSLRHALWIGLCLSVGAAGAPADVLPNAIGPDPAQAAPTGSGGEPGPASAVVEAGIERFDLQCSADGYGSARQEDEGGRFVPVRPWTFNFRYFVDLEAGKFCDPYWCEVSGVWRIHGVDRDTITFLDVHEPGFMTVETVDRRNGRFIRRHTDDDGWVSLLEGTCRQLPFSGFPDTSDSPLQDPWS